MEKKFIGRFGTMLAALLVGVNSSAMAVCANEKPDFEAVTAKVALSDISEKNGVSDLSITDLEMPAVGRALDGEATVMTEQGLSWKIPVIWLDDKGAVATKCEAGRKYLPTFAFYIPEGAEIKEGKDLSVSLSGLEGQPCFEKGLISIADPSSGITYLTTPKLAENDLESSIELLSVTAAGKKAGEYGSTYISRRDLEWSDLIGSNDMWAVQTYLGELGFMISNEALESFQGSLAGQYQQSELQSWQDTRNLNFQAYDAWTGLSTQSGQYQFDAVSDAFDLQGWQYQNHALQTWLDAQGGNYQEMASAIGQDESTGISSWDGMQNLQFWFNDAADRTSGQLWQFTDAAAGSLQSAQLLQGYDQTAGQEWTLAWYQDPYSDRQWSSSFYDNGYSFYNEPSNYTASENVVSGSGSNTSLADNLVSVHCTNGAISVIGRDNLQNLVHIIRDVIEPQAVYQLTTKFDSFSEAAKNGELGEQIGLYIYNSAVDNRDEYRNGQAYAYVLANVTGDKMEYFIGVDTSNFYHEANGKYVLNDDAFDVLSNTITHELMHAFMYDYTRTGMTGRPDKDNMFPSWFIEGIATTVDEAYNYQSDIYVLMQVGNRLSYSADDYLTGYTDQSVLSFYNGGVGTSEVGNPRLSNTGENRSASNYVTGYLACVYLGSMAASNAGYTVSSNSNGVTTYNSDAIRDGLDIVLSKLHNGTSLDEVIRTVSNNAYTGIDDFEDKFLKGSSSGNSYVSQDKASLDFCVDYLNYLNGVSNDLSLYSTDVELATGSLLMPLDSPERSPIEQQNPSDMPAQQVYSIVDSNDWVVSTVDPKVAFASAGTYSTGEGASSESRIDMAARLTESGVVLDIPEITMSYEEMLSAVSADDREGVSALTLEDLIGNMPEEYQGVSLQELIDACSGENALSVSE